MATIRRTALFALALLNVACAKESTKPAEATVTAAEMSTVQADRARLMRERDEARDELVDSQRRYDQAIEAAIERDQVADATWAAYDAAQAELKVLADKGGKLKGRAKEQFYTLLQDAMLKRDVVHSYIRRIHPEPSITWPRLKNDVQSAVDDLKKAVRQLAAHVGEQGAFTEPLPRAPAAKPPEPHKPEPHPTKLEPKAPKEPPAEPRNPPDEPRR